MREKPLGAELCLLLHVPLARCLSRTLEMVDLAVGIRRDVLPSGRCQLLLRSVPVLSHEVAVPALVLALVALALPLQAQGAALVLAPTVRVVLASYVLQLTPRRWENRAARYSGMIFPLRGLGVLLCGQPSPLK